MGVVHEAVPAIYDVPQVRREFRMGSDLFIRFYEEITDPVTAHHVFQENPDALGVAGATALQRLVCVMRQLAYGDAGDAAEAYSKNYLKLIKIR